MIRYVPAAQLSTPPSERGYRLHIVAIVGYFSYLKLKSPSRPYAWCYVNGETEMKALFSKHHRQLRVFVTHRGEKNVEKLSCDYRSLIT